MIFVKNHNNCIEIFPINREKFLIKYNFDEGISELEILDFEIYDFLIKIFRRKNLEKINLSIGFPLNFDDLEDEFGDLKNFENNIIVLLNSKTEYWDYGGNRVLTEFYKNILILRDDLGTAKSNVINLTDDQI